MWVNPPFQFAQNNTARYTINAGGMNQFHSGISAEGATFGGAVICDSLKVDGHWAGQHEEVIGIMVDNGNDVLTTGTKGHRTLPYACDIIDWRVTSTDSGAIEWGINYCTYANFPTMTAFCNSSFRCTWHCRFGLQR